MFALYMRYICIIMIQSLKWNYLMMKTYMINPFDRIIIYCFSLYFPNLCDWMCVVKLNTLRPRQNRRHFADEIFKWIFLNENVWISIKISLKFVPRGPISNITALVQIMAWRRPGDKPLSEPMMVRLLTHICVTRPQWFNATNHLLCNTWLNFWSP